MSHNENIILLGHGSGGLLSKELMLKYILPAFKNSTLEELSDSAVLDISKNKLAFSTDSFVVTPLFFNGGDIGKLAICGTINDLAVSFAKPLYLSCSFIIEEGFSLDLFNKILKSMANEADKAGIKIVTGDTKVVEQGKADKIFINTSGIGIIENYNTAKICEGDLILINGSLGDHGMTIYSTRENLGIETDLKSDCANLSGMISAVLAECNGVKFMRDPTRGGLASAGNEIVNEQNFGIILYEDKLNIKQEVATLCAMLGFDPLHIANEGKVMMIISPEVAQKAVKIMKNFEEGKDACIIGEITSSYKGKVILKTKFGTNRIVDMLTGNQLPRIC